MVAIVSGNNLGLNLGSLANLGNKGQFGTATQGRNGEHSYVNVSTGDLVLQDVDGSLAGVGSNAAAVRTYNSQGNFSTAGWIEAPTKSVTATGNGTLQRTDIDGSVNVYNWDAARQLYVATNAGGSALDTISVSGTGYTWTDGASGSHETYQGSGAGLLLSSTDTSGNTLTYTYGANNALIRTTNADGESINYTYSSGGLLSSVSTTLQSGQVVNEVSYTYDSLNRLQTVSVNLNPSGTVPAGSDTLTNYVTTYSYDGTSTRVTGVTQSDGTSLAFTYALVGSSYRVASVTDGNGQVTTFAYNTASNTTTVTDPLQVSAVYQYDSKGELTQIRNGVTASNAAGLTQLNYTYTAIGDVATVTDGLGHTVNFQYDANGNLTSQVDSAGNTQTRTYNAQNQVLTETVYAAPANGSSVAGQAQTTRYVYDAGNRNLLRFAISPEGRVTEYRYNAQGLRTAAIDYAAGTYDTASLAQTASPTEAQMQTWVSGQDLTQSHRTDFAYDFRGQLQNSATYASIDATGNGVANSAAVTRYVYDQQHQLLQTISPDGKSISQTIYDGLGRVVSSTAKSADGTQSITTLTQYDDANGKTTVTLANGLATTSAYDKAGRLVSVMQSAAGSNLGTTAYAYDADGRLLMTQDPTGQRSWFLYDSDGRKVADIDANGKLTETVYNADNQVAETIAYDTPVDTTKLVDGNGKPTTAYNANPAAAPAGTTPVTLASIRPAGTAQDAKTWDFYDAAGRLAWQVDALGRVTQTQYDGASRVIAVTAFATPISTTSLGNGVGVTLALAGSLNAGQAGVVTVNPNAADRTVTRIYDKDGLLRATIDGEGYLTEVRYNAAGEPVQTIGYATQVPGFTSAASIAGAVATARSSDSLAGLLPAASANDICTYTVYNDRGQVVGQVDGGGYLTETVYDANGNVDQTIRYANKANGPASSASTLASLRPASSPQDQVAANTWDALGRLATQTNAEGTVTQYAYDSVGHLIGTTTALNTADQRTLLTHYDVQGRVVGELSGVGAALITGNQMQAQIDAIWHQYATTYSYDAAGRRTSQTDANGNRTVFFYDNVGRLRYVVNAVGNVTENQYDALGHLTSTTQYATSVDAPTLAALQGGLLSATANQSAGAALAAAKQAAAPQNSTTLFAYDADGERIQTVDALGGTTTASYDAFGDQISTTQSISAGTSVTNTASYDRRGLQTGSVSDVGGLNATTSAQYDAFGRLIRSVDANGNVSQERYDQLGRVVSVTDPTGATRGSTYDAFGRVLTQTDALGNQTTYSYNTAQRSVTVTLADGVSMTTVHNREGQTASVMDGNGNTTTYAYDRDGNLLSITTPLTVTRNQYDAANRLIQTTDADGHSVVYAYDAANRLLSRTVDPSGLHLVTTYQYDAKGQQVQATDANGVVTLTCYDLKGEVVSQTVDPITSTHPNGLSLTTTYSYDQRGEQLTVTSPGGTVTQYVYDKLGRRTQTIVDPSGLHLATSYAYDNDGNVVATTDPQGNVTRYAYDGNNRVVYAVDGAGDVTHTIYDADGRITSQTRYVTPISLAGLGNAVSAATIASLVTASPGQDVVQSNVYDPAGRLTYTVDGLGDVTKFAYDGNGNVVDRVAYANRINPATWTPGSVPAVVADPAHDEEVRTVYDALNRAIYSLSSTGNGSQVAVVAQSYDGVGNVLTRTAYANTIPATTAPNAAAVAAALGSITHTPADVSVRNVYDAANRLTWTVDGVGAVTHFTYDNDGNVTSKIQYATALPTGANPSSVAVSNQDRETDWFYDAANRAIFQTQTLGDANDFVAGDLTHMRALTSYQYDANGNRVRTIQFAAPVFDYASQTAQQIWNGMTVTLAQDRVQSSAYDAAGRLVYAQDPSGAVTHYSYDGAGRLTSATQYANPVPVDESFNTNTDGSQGFLSHVPSAAQLAQAVQASAGLDRTTQYAYDGAGQQVYKVDPAGFVSQTRYDGIGRVTASTLYANAVAVNAQGNASTVAAAVVANAGADQTTSTAYDAAGNVVSTTDALGGVQRYTYNGVGDKLSYTNQNGATWTYDYDAAGRLIRETDPAVDVTSVMQDSMGNLVPAQTTAVNLVTVLTYDALGNLTARTEAAGTSSARTTQYQYDALGRQTKTIYPPVGVYDDTDLNNLTTDGAGGWARTESVRSLSTQVIYDVFGDAVANIDVAGNVSTKTYDRCGRVSYDVDALGYVTGYHRDAFGDVTSLTRYANATGVNAAVTVSGANVPTTDQVTQALTASSADRMIVTQYDQMGRAIEVTQPSTWVDNGNGQGYMAAAITRSTYNAFGQAVQVSVLADAAGGLSNATWATTTNYYDQRGQQVGTVDALGYVSTQRFDAAGNLVGQTQYAQAVPAGWTPASLTLPPSSANDRTVNYTYDQDNRKTSMTQVGVTVSSAWATGPNSAPQVSTQTVNLTTTYGYDALGNQTQTTDALGNTTYTYYDALGRTIAVAAPSRTITTAFSNVWWSLRPLTVFARDAFGNAVVRTDYANGTSDAGAGGYTAAWLSSGDRTTLTQYDSHGNAIQTTDANGHSAFMSYDVAGHLAKSWQVVTGNDGIGHTLYTAFQYDALGRQTAIITPGSSSVVSGASIVNESQQQAGSVTTGMTYNAFGEMVGRGSFATGSAAQYQEYFNYDNAGRLWRTNGGDGNVKVVLYDLQGRQTAQITSAGSVGGANAGTDLSQFANAQSVDQLGNAGLRRIDSQLDLLGRVTQQTLPVRYDSTDTQTGAYRPVVYQTFDRWGNVVSQSDVRSAAWVTQYQYNANNQVVRKTQPDGNGAISADSPVTQLFYDALGRQVAVTDANGNTNAQVWDAGGPLLQELHADGGVVQHSYDAFGEQTQLADAMGNVTQYGYDRLGRNTTITTAPVGVYTVAADNSVSGTTQQLVTTMVYDQAGHKIRQTDGAGDTTSYAYDLRGNVVAVTDADGYTHTAAFDAQGKQIAAQDANGKLATWSYDYFGELNGHTDIGGANYQFSYDAARQLVAQSNSRGQSLAYRYDAAGQLTEIDDNSPLNQQTYYAYNAAGQHVLEQTVQGGTTYQNQVLAYDKLGRLAHVEGMDGVTVDIAYDKVGNKLHQHTTYNTESQQTVIDYAQVQVGTTTDESGTTTTDESGTTTTDESGSTTSGTGTGTPIYQTVAIGSHTVYATTAHVQDQWFAYDGMNRQIMVDGAVDGNAQNLANIVPGQGHLLGYDKNGNRIEDQSWGTQVVPQYTQPVDESGNPTGAPVLAGYATHTGITTTWYSYDGLNRLSTVSTGAYALVQTGQQQTGTDEAGNPIYTPTYTQEALDPGQGIQLDVRRYDGASRVVESGPDSLPSDGTGMTTGLALSNGGTTGPLQTSYIAALAGSNTDQPGATTTVTRYDADGRVQSQHVVNQVDSSKNYDVVYQKTVVTGTHTVQVQTGTTPVLDESGNPTYDESGNPITTPVYTTQTITDTAQASTYDAAGNALGYRVTQGDVTTDYTMAQALYEGYQEGSVSAVSTNTSSGNQTSGTTTEQYDANGFLVGITDSAAGANNRSFINDASGHILFKNQQGNLLRQLVANGQVMGTYGFGVDPNNPTNSDGSPNYVQQGNFDLGYQPVTNSYPAAATGSYPVKSGDTLQSIAQAAYGDSALWYQIAQANGLTGNADLRVGQILNIPTRVGGTHNTANTFAPYDPSKVQGSTSPNLPTPAGNSDDSGCGGLGGILVMIVVVAVTVVAQQYELLPEELTAELGTTGTAIAYAEVGNLAGQAFGNAIGVEHGFDWSSVATTAISAGITSGLGNVSALSSDSLGSVGSAVAKATIGNALTQGVEVAVGLQKQFSWQQVAGAAAGAGLAYEAGDVFAKSDVAGSMGATTARVVGGALSGFVGGVTTSLMRGGRITATQVATDAFGNALGASLAQASSAPTPQAWDGSLYGSAPSYSYRDNTPTTGVFTQPSNAASSFDSDAAYNQLVETFSASQNGTSGPPDVLLAGRANITSDAPTPLEEGLIRVGDGDRSYVTRKYQDDSGTTAFDMADKTTSAKRLGDLTLYGVSSAPSPSYVSDWMRDMTSEPMFGGGIADRSYAGSGGYARSDYVGADGVLNVQIWGGGNGAPTQSPGPQGLVDDSWSRSPAERAATALPEELQRLQAVLSRPTGPQLVAGHGDAERTAAFNRYFNAVQGQPIGGLFATGAYLVTNDPRPAGMIADATEPLDSMWAPGSTRGSRSAASIRRRMVDVSDTVNGWTPLASRSRAYVRDIESQTGMPLTRSQRELLVDNLRENEYTRLSPEAAAKHRVEFNRVKGDLISEWQANTGQVWPTYTEPVLSKNGTVLRQIGQPYDAHHVIESAFGGPNEWWNMHPARFPDQHQGGIHRADGPLRNIFQR
ncbi:LysM peptidoglycan-binding domain-containing protein [Ralstonia sp. 1138]|uniref:LysM peptidoglycan-binding domain-containing protein n=1 Tax=Ralstonia sp. 1138 TaxID=3156423 RepID=UPI003394E267